VTKVVGLEKVDSLVRSGMTVMSAGFLGCGAAEKLIERLVELEVRGLTLISSDTAMPDKGAGKLIVNGSVKKLIASHIGTNPETIRRMNEGSLEVELVPQGTLAERIRAGGFGLGGILTSTGIGTIVEEGKTKLRIEGKEYLLELPLRAEVALIKGSIVDEAGNVYYRGTTQNFNAVMAMAADTVIVEAERLVPIGELPREWVMTPGIVVDFIVPKGGVS
jgi:acetate CoA/acetoacetate CoA-transferase alpha subunit